MNEQEFKQLVQRLTEAKLQLDEQCREVEELIKQLKVAEKDRDTQQGVVDNFRTQFDKAMDGVVGSA